MSAIARFLKHVASGHVDDVRQMLKASPDLVHQTGPHPYWGGQPQPLHVAVESKRVEMVELLLAHGADVNGRNDAYDGWSPLMVAINGRDDTAIRDLLIANGAHIGLVEALLLGDDEKVAALLREPLPEHVPNNGSLLAFARTPSAIDRLIDLGVSTAQKDRWGTTPVEALSRLGERGVPLLRRLVEHGVAAAPADLARLGDLEALTRLSEADESIPKEEAVMIAAVDGRHHRLVEWLLTHGANPNARADAQSRQTALHAAAWNGDLEMVRRLIEAGADPTARDMQYNATPLGWAQTSIEISKNRSCEDVVGYLSSPLALSTPATAALHAAHHGDVDGLRALLDAHPDVRDARATPYGSTLLHLAAAAGHLAVVDLLLARDFDVNARDVGDNAYAMHFAAGAGHLEVVRRLADAGGDVIGEGDDHGLEVIGWATCFGEAHREVAEFLLARGARHHIFSAIAMNDGAEVRRIVAADPSAVNLRMSRNEEHRLPLHHAVAVNRPDMASLLIELGADPLAVDGSGLPAAAYARSADVDRSAMQRIRELTRSELQSAERGARPARTTRTDLLAALALEDWGLAERLLAGENERLGPAGTYDGALHLMAKRQHVAAVRWLLAHGADPNSRWQHWDAKVTPLHLAAGWGTADIVKLLLDAGGDPDLRDTKHHGDAEGWAGHFGRKDIVALLKAHSAASDTT